MVTSLPLDMTTYFVLVDVIKSVHTTCCKLSTGVNNVVLPPREQCRAANEQCYAANEQCCAAACEQCCAANCEQCCAANCEQCCAAPSEQCCQQGCSAMITMLLQYCSTNTVLQLLNKVEQR